MIQAGILFGTLESSAGHEYDPSTLGTFSRSFKNGTNIRPTSAAAASIWSKIRALLSSHGPLGLEATIAIETAPRCSSHPPRSPSHRSHRSIHCRPPPCLRRVQQATRWIYTFNRRSDSDPAINLGRNEIEHRRSGGVGEQGDENESRKKSTSREDLKLYNGPLMRNWFNTKRAIDRSLSSSDAEYRKTYSSV
jgi:hypothetical protein